MIGITNQHEFYAEHYIAAILAGDIRPVLQRWREEANAEGDLDEAERQATPMRLLSALQQPFFRYRDRLERVRQPAERVARHAAISREKSLGGRTLKNDFGLGVGVGVANDHFSIIGNCRRN